MEGALALLLPPDTHQSHAQVHTAIWLKEAP